MADLASLERAVHRRSDDRIDVMMGFLWSLSNGQLVEDAGRSGDEASEQALVTRASAAVGAVLADAELTWTSDQIGQVLTFKFLVDRLFKVGAFGSSDFLLRAAEGDDSEAGLLCRLLLQSLDSDLDMPLERVAALPKDVGLHAAAAFAASKPLATRAGHERRDRLLEMSGAFDGGAMPMSMSALNIYSSAWMVCSYASSPDKHRIKRPINSAFRGFTDRLGLHDHFKPARRPLADRPVMVVAAEIMNARHVQYRYFGQYLRQLRQRFELVLVCETSEADEAARALFDRVLTFERQGSGRHLNQAHALIVGAQPDIVFWPSVGMRHWGPPLANLRLAPIQFVGLGHSASTFIPAMDYYLCEEGYVGDPSRVGETLVLLPDESLVFERPPGDRPQPLNIRQTPDPLRIVVAANALKLNPPFLETLAAVRAAAGRKLEFHFMPGSSGLEREAVARAITAHIPDAVVHGNMTHDRYLQVLSACDLSLSPFPFGGLHSVVDALRQAVPVVAMECEELHGRTDAMLLRRLGLPESLIATNRDDYVAAALRVIQDDRLRVSLSVQAIAANVDQRLFGDAQSLQGTPLRTEVVDAVAWLYQHHEAIQAEGRQAWSLAGRAAWAAPRNQPAQVKGDKPGDIAL